MAAGVRLFIALTGLALSAWLAPSRAQTAGITVGSADLGGVVSGPSGPEAGVWVIAETTDLPTKFARIVVTDAQGRYLVPDLPQANYTVWVRGYGLVDSPKVRSEPGKMLNLTAVPAPSPAAAAEYYPAEYWFSMLRIPDVSEFPGTGAGPGGNGIERTMKTQGQWLDSIKSNGCVGCHQLGNLPTRTVSPALGHFDSSLEAWSRRIQSGQASTSMVGDIARFGANKALSLFADWTDRIAKGELPASQPPRPQGVERNVVVTVWDWGTPTSYLHDAISTDKRHPTVNGYGKVYGSPELSSDRMPVLDPVSNEASLLEVPWRDPAIRSTKDDPIYAPSVYWGDDRIWDSHTVVHNPMFDAQGRLWLTARFRASANPSFCQTGSDLPSAKLSPTKTSGRQFEIYDPKTGKFTFVDTCFGTSHLEFGFDGNDTLWAGGGGVVGWLDTKKFLATGDAAQAQGWTALVLDTNGNGQRDASVGAKDAIDPTKDKEIQASYYGIAVSPSDGAVWGSIRGYPGAFVRLALGSNPPATALAEYYELPATNPAAAMQGSGPRGMDVDSHGVVWAGLSSGQFVSFDRRLCKGPLNGPTATGQHCPEGFKFYPMPGPQFAGVSMAGSVESSYYTWVDQHDTLGLGADVPVYTGNEAGALGAFKDGKFLVLRLPYPLGFFPKGLDGRIDDPAAGWKGRGLWATFGNRTPQHIEGGKGTLPKLVHFQLRPDPLAR
jgi:hypothetical protein